jgi:hypothetical protein
MSDLRDFVLARIAEQEVLGDDLVRWPYEPTAGGSLLRQRVNGRRILAECKAHRRIVEVFGWATEPGAAHTRAEWFPAILAIRVLASMHSDHPDYRPHEWSTS